MNTTGYTTELGYGETKTVENEHDNLFNDCEIIDNCEIIDDKNSSDLQFDKSNQVNIEQKKLELLYDLSTIDKTYMVKYIKESIKQQKFTNIKELICETDHFDFSLILSEKEHFVDIFDKKGITLLMWLIINYNDEHYDIINLENSISHMLINMDQLH